MTDRALQGKRVQANGLSFYVVDEGAGPAVILLHGFPDSADVWRHQVPALVEAGFRVIAPDLRGFGDSERPSNVDEYFILNAVNDIVALTDTLEIDQFDVVGHDFGAGVAWVLASAAPTRIRKLVALSVGNGRALLRPRLSQMRASWYSFFFQFQGVAEALLVRDDWALMREWAATHPDPDGVVEQLGRAGALTAGLNWYRANFRPEVWGADLPLPTIQAPTLGIWGSGDDFLEEEQMVDSGEFVAARWRYERIEGAGHWVQLEKPEVINALLLEFLRG